MFRLKRQQPVAILRMPLAPIEGGSDPSATCALLLRRLSRIILDSQFAIAAQDPPVVIAIQSWAVVPVIVQN